MTFIVSEARGTWAHSAPNFLKPKHRSSRREKLYLHTLLPALHVLIDSLRKEIRCTEAKASGRPRWFQWRLRPPLRLVKTETGVRWSKGWGMDHKTGKELAKMRRKLGQQLNARSRVVAEMREEDRFGNIKGNCGMRKRWADGKRGWTGLSPEEVEECAEDGSDEDIWDW